MAQMRKPVILDETVRLVVERMLSTPPLSRDEVKVEKSKPAKSTARRAVSKARSKRRKPKRSR
jgi:hypothetical protein